MNKEISFVQNISEDTVNHNSALNSDQSGNQNIKSNDDHCCGAFIGSVQVIQEPIESIKWDYSTQPKGRKPFSSTQHWKSRTKDKKDTNASPNDTESTIFTIPVWFTSLVIVLL